MDNSSGGSKGMEVISLDPPMTRKRKIDQLEFESGLHAGDCGAPVPCKTPLFHPSSLMDGGDVSGCMQPMPACRHFGSWLEVDVRDKYQYNMTQIRTAYEHAVSLLEDKISLYEEREKTLTHQLQEKDNTIQTLSLALEDVRHIRRAVFTGPKPARMCLCGTYTTSFQDLSPELLVTIFAQFDAISRQSLTRVCRQWKDIINSPAQKHCVILDAPILYTHRKKNTLSVYREFLQNVYSHTLDESTESIFLIGNSKLDLSSAFDLDERNLCTRLATLCPRLRRMTFARLLLSWSHILTLPTTIQSVTLQKVELVERMRPGGTPANAESAAKVERCVINMEGDVENVLLELMNDNAPRLKKTDKVEILQSLPKLTGEKKEQVISLLQKREPGNKKLFESDVSKWGNSQLRALKPWSKIGLLAIIRGQTSKARAKSEDPSKKSR